MMIVRIVFAVCFLAALSCSSTNEICTGNKVTQEVSCEIGRINYAIEKDEKGLYKMRLVFHKKRGTKPYVHSVKEKHLSSQDPFIKKGTRLYYRCNYEPEYYIAQRFNYLTLGNVWRLTCYFQPEDKCVFSQFFYLGERAFECEISLDKNDIDLGKVTCSFGEYEAPE
ncbi:MAG: hypothetical protein AB8F95_09525 [Bacteroidia bacterium]